ncbi:MAG TPA: hypothetical protein VLE96_07510, partial [Chlamydiales bacterium]|nr:hypothetical protein [Chlamydiales bacterium]
MTAFNRPSGKKRTLILSCIAISLIVHGVGLYIFYKNPLILQSSWASLFKRSATHPHPLLVEETISIQEKNQSLTEALAHFEKPSSTSQKPYDLDYNLNTLKTRPHVELASGIELPRMREESSIH